MIVQYNRQKAHIRYERCTMPIQGTRGCPKAYGIGDNRRECKMTYWASFHANRGLDHLRPVTASEHCTVGLESIAMFGSFGLFAVWCYTVKKSHLALQRESKVLLPGFLMDFISYTLNQ
jgi:hypothetical protein